MEERLGTILPSSSTSPERTTSTVPPFSPAALTNGMPTEYRMVFTPTPVLLTTQSTTPQTISSMPAMTIISTTSSQSQILTSDSLSSGNVATSSVSTSTSSQSQSAMSNSLSSRNAVTNSTPLTLSALSTSTSGTRTTTHSISDTTPSPTQTTQSSTLLTSNITRNQNYTTLNELYETFPLMPLRVPIVPPHRPDPNPGVRRLRFPALPLSVRRRQATLRQRYQDMTQRYNRMPATPIRNLPNAWAQHIVPPISALLDVIMDLYEQIYDVLSGAILAAEYDAIEQLTIPYVYKAREGANTENCMICLLEVKDGDNVRRLRCLHFFHIDCIDRWLERVHVCPLCRTNISPAVQLQDHRGSQ